MLADISRVSLAASLSAQDRTSPVRFVISVIFHGLESADLKVALGRREAPESDRALAKVGQVPSGDSRRTAFLPASAVMAFAPVTPPLRVIRAVDRSGAGSRRRA
ncbi:MAG TPA: hypothetical protein VFY87_31225, partial [Geminicoccaceae bacterium]|nr:hypothetical protein [Geminicoccaceae bacterium]